MVRVPYVLTEVTGCNMLPSCCSFLTPVIFGTAVCDSVLQLHGRYCIHPVQWMKLLLQFLNGLFYIAVTLKNALLFVAVICF